MSSDDLYNLAATADLDVVRQVLDDAGFSDDGVMSEEREAAARALILQIRQGDRAFTGLVAVLALDALNGRLVTTDAVDDVSAQGRISEGTLH